MDQMNKAVVTVVGKDTIGIIAQVSAVLARHMMMIVDISLSRFEAIEEELAKLAEEKGLQIRIQRSEIFDAMHRI